MSKLVFSLVFALPLFAASAVFAAAEVEENLPDYAKASGVSGTISSAASLSPLGSALTLHYYSQ